MSSLINAALTPFVRYARGLDISEELMGLIVSKEAPRGAARRQTWQELVCAALRLARSSREANRRRAQPSSYACVGVSRPLHPPV